MKTRSDAFQFEKELDWEKPAPGIRRQIIDVYKRQGLLQTRLYLTPDHLIYLYVCVKTKRAVL